MTACFSLRPGRSNPLRSFAILLTALLFASLAAAAGPEPLTKITVRAVDEQGKTIKDLHQDEFVLKEDGEEQVIDWWRKSSIFGRVRYQLGYTPKRPRDGRQRRVEVQVKRQGAVAEFSPKHVR